MKFQSTLSAAAVFSAASAHTIFLQLTAGGVTNRQFIEMFREEEHAAN